MVHRLAISVNHYIGRGVLNLQIPEELLDLFEEVVIAEQIWNNERAMAKRKNGMMDVNRLTIMNTKLKALTREIKNTKVNAISSTSLYKLCQRGYATIDYTLMQYNVSELYAKQRQSLCQYLQPFMEKSS